ncbi:MAG: UDP-N-acetylglucosamine 1-carboxyvinyltransferase [Alphaproteobacteria bacterium]|nr:UDP-N-acetylglucosamine 1-carboxyvinyltransferase [Alphaproteobacteria bacterium]
MDKLLITGGTALKGEIAISGAKNAALPLMATALMAEEGMVLDNLPSLADTDCMCELLAHLGVESVREGDTVSFASARGAETDAPYEIVRKMRASVLVLGPLLARYGRARVSLPGGCAIGSRPVDLHIMAMEALGAKVTLEEGDVLAEAAGGLIGGDVVFPTVSVGATENVLMAAALAKGTSRLINVAREPEIIDLAECLIAMGAKISGQGTDVIEVEGVTALTSCRHAVVADRIEAGTFALAAAITQGQITLTHARADHLASLFAAMAASGVQVEIDGDRITVTATERPRPVDITTDPYPGFPTDLQAQFMALMTVASGTSQVAETIFENRFMHVPELARMGANIQVNGGHALVRGVEQLTAAPVMATDLRASVSLVLAALVAEGETTLQRVYHLDRGYDRLEEKLSACGAKIRRVRG